MALETEKLTVNETQIKPVVAAEAALQGSVLVLIQFDVCEEIKHQLEIISSFRRVVRPSEIIAGVFLHPLCSLN